MKQLLILGVTLILISSCTQPQSDNKYMSDYEYKNQRDLILDSLSSRTDTLILDFVLGMSEYSYNKKIKNMISSDKLGQKAEIKVNVGGQYYKVDGFPYDFYLSTKKNESLLKGDFYNKKLSKIEIILYNVDTYADDIIVNMYDKKYGEHLRKKNESGTTSYFWIINNLEIKIDYFISQSLIFITYNDLIVQRQIEEIEKAEKEKIMNKNRELSKKTQDEI